MSIQTIIAQVAETHTLSKAKTRRIFDSIFAAIATDAETSTEKKKANKKKREKTKKEK